MSIKSMKITLSLLFAYLLINCVNLLNQEVRLQNYQARLDDDMQQVQAEQEQLQQELAYYSTPEGVEELARKRLGYYKKGELPLRVIASAPSDAQADSPVVDAHIRTPAE